MPRAENVCRHKRAAARREQDLLSQSLKQKNKLYRPADYKRVFESSVRVSDSSLLLLARASGEKNARLGLAISKKKISSAVKRNLIKRLTRESFRQNKKFLNGWDVVVITHRKLDKIDKQAITKTLNRHWQTLQKCKKS